MSTTAATGTDWQISGSEVVICNCDWGCPCQFNALPTHGFCEALGVWQIDSGHFGDTSLDGVVYAQAFHWDGAVHEGNGWRQLVVDERATPEQREAIEALTAGRHGHPVFVIFSSMAPNAGPTKVAPIDIECDRERRQARVHVHGFGEGQVEPIRNPVTGDEHRARIDLPNGFEYLVAEVGNAARWHVSGGDHLTMDHENTYAQLAPIHWSSDGTTR